MQFGFIALIKKLKVFWNLVEQGIMVSESRHDWFKFFFYENVYFFTNNATSFIFCFQRTKIVNIQVFSKILIPPPKYVLPIIA